MGNDSSSSPERTPGLADTQFRVPVSALLPFLLITFSIAWGILGLYIGLPQRMSALFGELTGQHPLFYLAVYAPAIAAFVVVTLRGGLSGLLRFVSRIALWRCSISWYVFCIVGVPLVFLIGAALRGSFPGEGTGFTSLGALLCASALMLIKGPVEEFGWRGLALPLLQRRLAPIWAGLVLGLIWGFWHLPAFLLSSTPQGGWAFAPFFVGSVAISVIATPMFNRARGSILLPALFHFQLINPLWPDAQPYDTYILVVAAVVIVWLNRMSMFTSADAVVRVIPAGTERSRGV